MTARSDSLVGRILAHIEANGPCTKHQLAKALDMQESKTLRTALWQIVASGRLERELLHKGCFGARPAVYSIPVPFAMPTMRCCSSWAWHATGTKAKDNRRAG